MVLILDLSQKYSFQSLLIFTSNQKTGVQRLFTLSYFWNNCLKSSSLPWYSSFIRDKANAPHNSPVDFSKILNLCLCSISHSLL
ncbi:hypothetical protein FGO68_gene10485 [Halteria grandinella]|uniref:Uncharacterized protein n=1 Tax=Halteria grandinella TaxID=5974 RepID=A0A8J8NKE7_HALGN|nr:hypothetical protein FGO68_gene10485 [Halteria grandinella]